MTTREPPSWAGKPTPPHGREAAPGPETPSGDDSASIFARRVHELAGDASAPGAGVRTLWVVPISTPLGPVVAAADETCVRFLEFADRRPLPEQLLRFGRRGPKVFAPSQNFVLGRLAEELDEYFAGARRAFDVPVHPCGTPFQERVWSALRGIPSGETRSYSELASAIGRPRAVRAVAHANADNPIAILVPCHRVIGADGSLTGYGGGLWRKRRLLDLEGAG